MRYIENEFRRMGNPDAAKVVADLREKMSVQLRQQYGVDDIPTPKLQDVLAQAAREFKTSPLTPELVTATFQTIWQARGERVGIEVLVVPCDRSAEELAELVKADRRIGYLPEQLMEQNDRSMLVKMSGGLFTLLGGFGVESGNWVRNEVDRFGWFDYEASVDDAPYLDTTEDQLRERIAADGRLGMNLNEYMVASQDNKLFTGKFLDEDNAYVRLLGSRFRINGEVRVVYACFPGGALNVGWHLIPQGHEPRLGGCSVGVKKT